MSDSLAWPQTLWESAAFRDCGYRGLYGGLDAAGLRRRRGLSENEPLLGRMGTTELAANLFQATQTEDQLRRAGVGAALAAKTHEEVGCRIRQTIEDIGGARPEDLPSFEIGVKVTVDKRSWSSMDDANG